MDLMALEDERPPKAGQEVAFWSLGETEEAGTLVPTTVEILHRPYFKDGQVREKAPAWVCVCVCVCVFPHSKSSRYRP